MPARLRIARGHGWRRFPLFCEKFRDDAEQTAWMVALTCRQKHLTTREFQRLCGRIWYAVARAYGFRRAYRAGNNKTGWYPSEEQLNGSSEERNRLQ
jgi:hypothetical protein